jgi:signal transduction histidine kinase
MLERIIAGSDRQLDLINSLLEAHSTEVQGVILHCQPIQLHPLIQSALSDLQPILVKEQATLTHHISPDLPLINADSLQLWRVYENLIVNALKHNPPGLSLTLNAQVEGDWIRCTVADDGVGMNQQQCTKLFELYFRGSQSRRSIGLGLGLYLCRQIIIAHGGEIGVQSCPGGGTTFWFTLPLAISPKISSTESEAVNQVDGTRGVLT